MRFLCVYLLSATLGAILYGGSNSNRIPDASGFIPGMSLTELCLVELRKLGYYKCLTTGPSCLRFGFVKWWPVYQV